MADLGRKPGGVFRELWPQGDFEQCGRGQGQNANPSEHNIARASNNLAKGAWKSDRASERLPERAAYFAPSEVARETCDISRKAIEPHVAASPGVEPFVNREAAWALTPKDSQDWESILFSGKQASGIAASVEVAGHGNRLSVLSGNLFRQADIKQHDLSVGREETTLLTEARMETMRRMARQMVKGNPESAHQAPDASKRVLPGCMHGLARDVPALFPNGRVEETALEVAGMGKGQTSDVFAERLAGPSQKNYARVVSGLGVAALTRAEQEGSLDREGMMLAKALSKAGREGAQIDVKVLSGLAERLLETSPARALCATSVAGDSLRSRHRQTSKSRNEERVA